MFPLLFLPFRSPPPPTPSKKSKTKQKQQTNTQKNNNNSNDTFIIFAAFENFDTFVGSDIWDIQKQPVNQWQPANQ